MRGNNFSVTEPCRLSTRISIDKSCIEIAVMPDSSQNSQFVINLHTVEAVDDLIAQLIKMRDLMEQTGETRE